MAHFIREATVGSMTFARLSKKRERESERRRRDRFLGTVFAHRPTYFRKSETPLPPRRHVSNVAHGGR